MEFEPLNPLEFSLVKAATDPSHRPQFYKDLLKEDIFVIQEGHNENLPVGKGTLETGIQLHIRHMEWEGRPYIPVFSAIERLQLVIQEEVSFIALNALEFMKITKGAELLLNPGLDYGKAFTQHEIAALIDGSIWGPSEQFVAEKETNVMIGQPANYPTQLLENLSKFFKKRKSVKKAYIAHFYNPEDGEKPHTLIGVEATGDWHETIAGAGMVVEGSEVPDPPVDFIQVDGGDGIQSYFHKDSQPFYQRKLLGIF